MLVEEEDKPRGIWKLARVTSLITGKDGHTRGAILHVPSSGGNGVLQRPIQRIYPLETVVNHQTERSLLRLLKRNLMMRLIHNGDPDKQPQLR